MTVEMGFLKICRRNFDFNLQIFYFSPALQDKAKILEIQQKCIEKNVVKGGTF